MKIILILSAVWLSFGLLQAEQPYWIFFSGKGSDPEPALSQLAMEKRVRKGISLDQFTDAPVSRSYIKILREKGIEIRRQSRWFNAVSAILNDAALTEIRDLPFVNGVQPVRTLKIRRDPGTGPDHLSKTGSEYYGPSDNQVRMIGIPQLHEMGFSGEGVRIALFDTGFRLGHESLREITVIDTYDFINNDRNVDNEAGDSPGQYHHGTRVLSVIGGFKPGVLVGPAYRSEYLLAKTEDIASETHLEEDNWVAAAEWADSLGADIISSSLGYTTFDTGEGDYSYADMNGNTTIITRAANIAVEKGIAVFTSAGNEGTGSWYHIGAPADGFDVIAVGGLNPDGSFWPASSRGPTSDGRIKPEVVAQAASVFNADPLTNDGYSVSSGTSLSCPLAAGSGALLLSINPNLDPRTLRQLMIRSASQFQHPDNDVGYGMVDLASALQILTAEPVVEVSDLTARSENGRNLISWNVHMEISNGFWSLQRREGEGKRREIARLEGNAFSLERRPYEILDNDFSGGEWFEYILMAQPGGGDPIGIDSVRIRTAIADRYALAANYPNPFNNQTTVTLSLNRAAVMSVSVFNAAGQRIRLLVDNQPLDAGYHHYIWNGENENGVPVSSGMYFVVAWDGLEKRARKLVLLK